MDLWIDVQHGRYGLAGVSGYTESKTNQLDFTVDKDLQMTVSQPMGTIQQSNWWTPSTVRGRGWMPVIRFQPDGFVSDTSPGNIVFKDVDSTGRQGTGSQTWIVENPNHAKYDLDANHSPVSRF